MHIVTTHKGTDFDALASVVAVNLLYRDVVAVLPQSLNPNVRAFLSLHKDLFGFCKSREIDHGEVDKLIVVDTNRWNRLDRMESLKENKNLEIILFDHHDHAGDINSTWRCQEEMGANITLMIRYLKERKIAITPIQKRLSKDEEKIPPAIAGQGVHEHGCDDHPPGGKSGSCSPLDD